jgi:hypothetical protein
MEGAMSLKSWWTGARVLSCAIFVLLGCSASDNSGGSRSNGSGLGTGVGTGGLGAGSAGTGTGTGKGFGNTQQPVGSGTGAGAMPNGMAMECASALVHTSHNMPTIEFVIDGSGSMCAPFGGASTRWQSVRTALLDKMKGLIYRLEKSVTFGAVLYDGTIDIGLALSLPMGGGGMGMGGGSTNPMCSLMYVQNKAMGDCPQLIDVPPALNNAAAIDMKYPMTELGGSTPTDKAMKHVMDLLIASRPPPGPDMKPVSPLYVILATDGAPNDICVNGAGGDGTAQQQGVVDAVDRGAAVGIKTWVISLAMDAALQAHLDNVAHHGDPTNPMAHTFNPTNPDQLVTALAQLLGGAVGCNVALSGMVKVGQECTGKVELNGVKLPCCQQDMGGAWKCDGMPAAAPNGWHLTDPGSIELLGDTCANFLIASDDMLHASFPCNVFTPS